MALANSGQAPPPYAGRYRLEQVLGRGPSGVVYDAVDLQAGGAMVAVKRLHPHHHDEQALLALQRDALSAAALCHPALAAPTVSGTDEEGGFYLAGPLVPGEALRQRLQRGPLSAAEVRGVFSAVCAGLDAAHRAGIHHGDLHPGNILCPGPGAAVVTDFGMAQLGQGAGSLWVGAPGYIAPEVYRGESAPATARADVFSLGAVLYECLTGQRPFAGPSPAAVMFKVCVSPLPGLPAAVPLPGERTRLEALLAMACDKDPERRFDNPAALWHAMDAVLTGEEAAAPAPAPTSPVAAPRRRTSQEQAAWFENEGRGEGEGDGQEALAGAPRPARPWRVALAAGAGGLVVLAGVLLFAPGRSPPPPVPAVAPAPAPVPASADTAAAALLLRGEEKLAAQDYPAALALAEELRRLRPQDPRAQDLYHRASESMRQSGLYQGFLRAADRGDDEAAVALFEELPADSLLRTQGQAAFAAVRQRLLHLQRELASAALQAGACDEAAGHLAQARRFAGGADAGLAGDEHSLRRCRARSAPQRRAASSPAHPAPVLFVPAAPGAGGGVAGSGLKNPFARPAR